MTTDSPATLASEANIISRYLLRQTLTAPMLALYVQACSDVAVSADERRILSFARRHPRLIGLLDGGLALLNPNHELRRRIFIVFALLEASPEHHASFLPVDQKPWYLLAVGLAGVHGVARAIGGVLILKLGSYNV